MISPLSNTADVTCHILRLVEQEATRDMREIFVDQQALIAVRPTLVQVTPDFSFEKLEWPQEVTDQQVPALRSLLSWLGQQESAAGTTNVTVHRKRTFIPALAEEGRRGVSGAKGREGKRGPEGREGREGPEGVRGPEGAGPQGPEGVGLQGPEGPEGARGPEGPEGVGLQGPAGPEGAQGAGGP